MADLLLSRLDMVSVRFAASRATETALSVRVLQHDPTGLHRAWARTTRERLAARPDVDLAVLLALVPARGFYADLLAPTLPSEPPDLATELDALRALDPQLLVRDVEGVRRGAPGRGAQVDRVLDDLAREPRAGLARVADALEGFWAVALEDHWGTIQRLLDADVRQRAARLAQHGLRPLLHELSPRVELLSDRLRVTASWWGDRELDGGRGLVLTPSAFAEPRGLIALDGPFVPTVIYHVVGVGNLWAAQEDRDDHALDEVLGRTRAQLLRAVGIPATTTELAAQLELSAGTVSEHLAILRRGGLVAPSRTGRSVLYRRTAAADALLAASAR